VILEAVPERSPLPGPVEARRPLTARSVIASTLLGVDPPRLPTLALVRSGELFGLKEGATRTALSRMAASGEVVAEDGHHVLAGPLLDRHARQRAARRTDRTPTREWDGTWILAVVRPEPRAAPDRASFRAAARRLHLAEVREGIWARPDDLDPDDRSADATRIGQQATWVRGARPDDTEPFLAAFHLDRWAEQARALIREMEGSQPALDAHDTDVVAETFVISAAVLRHLLADPGLPSHVNPDDWPASHLRNRFDRFDAAFKATWRAWYGSFREIDPHKKRASP
jgi:phenylacetic acid degradation operon negative regulatory protein